MEIKIPKKRLKTEITKMIENTEKIKKIESIRETEKTEKIEMIEKKEKKGKIEKIEKIKTAEKVERIGIETKNHITREVKVAQVRTAEAEATAKEGINMDKGTKRIINEVTLVQRRDQAEVRVTLIKRKKTTNTTAVNHIATAMAV